MTLSFIGLRDPVEIAFLSLHSPSVQREENSSDRESWQGDPEMLHELCVAPCWTHDMGSVSDCHMFSQQPWCHALGDSCQLGGHLHIWPPCSRPEVPTTLSLGSVNLLERFTELGETFSLLDYQLIRKGYNSETAGWKRCLGKMQRKDAELPHPL